MELPALDFSKFTAGSQAQKRELAEALVDSLDVHGFVKLINHGVPDEVVESLLDLVFPPCHTYDPIVKSKMHIRLDGSSKCQ